MTTAQIGQTIQPQLIDPLFDSIFGRHFHVVQGNADVTQAQIIFLGNTHYREEQQWRISWLIQQLYRQHVDTIFTETYFENPKYCSETRHVTIPLSLRGWDSKTRQKEFEQKNRLIEMLLHIDHVRKHGLAHENWMEALDKLCDLYSIFKEPSNPEELSPPNASADVNADANAPQSSSEESEGNCEGNVEPDGSLDSPQARLEIFNDFVYSIAESVYKYLNKELEDQFPERNACMLQNIDAILSDSTNPSTDLRRIFVIAGIGHFTWDSRFTAATFNNPSSIESIKNIYQWCSDKKYIILYPNEDSDINEVKNVLNPSIRYIFRGYLKEKKYCKITKMALVCTGLFLGFTVAAILVSPIAIPYIGYRKVKKCCAYCRRDHYLESLKKLTIPELNILLIYAAEHPYSSPRQVGVFPIEQGKEQSENLTRRKGEEIADHEAKDASADMDVTVTIPLTTPILDS